MTTPKNPNGWCTNWDAFNVEGIWKMVEKEGDSRAQDQVRAWAAVESGVSGHLRWLTAFQAEMESIWPTTGEASAAFSRQIDMLKASMEETASASGRTKHALDDILDKMAETKAAIGKLRGDYQESSGDWVPRQIDGAEDEINEQARKIMSEAEMAVRDRTPSIVAPPQFRTMDAGDTGGESPQPRTGPGNSRGGDVSDVIPPLRHDPPAPLAGIDPMMPDGRDWQPSPTDTGRSDGPVLSTLPGVIEPPVAHPNPYPAPVPPPGNPQPGLPGIGPVIGGGGPLGNSGIKPTGSAGRLPFGAGPPGGAKSGRTGMPANGIIGATPTNTGGRSGNAAAGGRGGAIGGAAAGGRGGAIGGRGGQVPGMMGAGAGRRGGQPSEGDEDDYGWDPDNPWAADEGVAPVIESDRRNYRHDPGPGVIGGA